MKKTCFIPFIFLIFNLLFLNGCWDIREINDLGFVTAVGIDKAEPPNKYSVTAQIANASAAAAKSEQGQAQSEVWIGTGEGKSIFDAIRNLIRISSRRIMWAHNNVIIIGESLAKVSIAPVADFFTHNPELRMKTPVVVSKGDAKEYISAKAGMDTPSGLSFIYFRDYGPLLGETVQSSMLTVSATLATQYVQPLIAAVSLKKMAAPPEEAGQSGAAKEAKTIDISGAAVFNNARMLGWLSPLETRGIAWIMNETKNTVVTVIDPMHQSRSVVVEIKDVKAEITTKIVGGMPRIMIKLKGGGNITEEDGRVNQGIEKVKKQIGRLVEQEISAEIKTSLQKIQHEYQSDVVGFGDFIRVQHNREWESGLKENWETIFPQVQVTVKVKIHIHSNMLKQIPAKYISTKSHLKKDYKNSKFNFTNND